jgi:hypothetical protein
MYRVDEAERLIVPPVLERFPSLFARLQIDPFQTNIDGGFADLNSFLKILAGIFSGLVIAVISLVIWDRRTALAPAVRCSQDLEQRGERVEQALRMLAQKDPNVLKCCGRLVCCEE